jgi:hypothetical protein
MTARKLAEADAQIQTLRRHVAEECVAITSSIDTIPPAMVPREMRDRWLRALRQAMRPAGTRPVASDMSPSGSPTKLTEP